MQSLWPTLSTPHTLGSYSSNGPHTRWEQNYKTKAKEAISLFSEKFAHNYGEYEEH